MTENKKCLCNEIDYHEIIDCIMSALDARDPYTAGHSERVSDMSIIVCELLGMSVEETQAVHIAAHLHDIGKIGIPDNVLLKTEKLTDEDWQKLKKHPEIGAEILNKSHHLRELTDIVLHHHERFDGKGYPSGLVGENIPLGARIIAICDSIDAMTSNRCYRKAHSIEFCHSEIEKNLGIMYDPKIGQIVLDNWGKFEELI